MDPALLSTGRKDAKKRKKCFITECKQKAEFIATENGHQIQLCPLHYERHENKHKKFNDVQFRKASEVK